MGSRTAAVLLAGAFAAGSLSVITPVARAVEPTQPFGSCGVQDLSLYDNFGSGPSGADPLVVLSLPDDKVVLLLATGDLLRLLPDGMPDPTFGAHGVAGAWPARVLAMQPDGKTVAAGWPYGGYELVVKRFTTNGALDPSFGSDGVATIVRPARGGVSQVAVAPDGTIVVAGAVHEGWMVTRLLPNGAVDTSFGQLGFIHVPFPEHSGPSLAIQPDGKILLAGEGATPESPFALLRLNPDGVLDASFGVGGRAGFAVEPQWYFVSPVEVGVDPSGRIVAFFASMATQDGQLLARFTSAGQPDPTFGTGGVLSTGVNSGARSFSIEPDGGLLMPVTVGVPGQGSQYQGIRRITPAGAIDGTFGIAAGLRSPDPPGGPGMWGPVTRRADGGWAIAGWRVFVTRVSRDGRAYAADTGPACTRIVTTSSNGLRFRANSGGTSATQTATFTNTGTSAVTTGAAYVQGREADQYRITSDGCAGRTIPSGGACAVSLVLAPTPAAPGASFSSSHLLVPTNAAGAFVGPSLQGTVDPPGVPRAPYSVWLAPNGSALDATGTWVVSTNEPYALGGQLPPSYLYGHHFYFTNSPALGTVGLTSDQAGKFAVFIIAGGDNVYRRASVPFSWRPGVAYFLLAQRVSGAYHAAVLDSSTGTWTTIGPLAVPAEWGALSTVSLTMLTWYGPIADSCAAYPRADVLFYPPLGFSGGAAAIANRLATGIAEYGNCAPQNSVLSGVWAHYGFGIAL